jgi:hypothetical protein
LLITAVIITLAGISLYFLLKPPIDPQYEQLLSDETISELDISSDGTTEKTIVKSILHRC